MSAEPVPFGRPERRDWLDELHTRLVADARQHPPYAAGTVGSLEAYSEGAEHALDSVRLQPHKLAQPRVVVRSIDHLSALPHGTVMMTAARSVVQVQHDEDAHQLLYMGTEETDPLDPIALWWQKQARHTLTLILPCVILNP